MTIMKNRPWHFEEGCKGIGVKIFKNIKPLNLLEKFYKSCVSLHCHSHGGVDTGGEGDVDEGYQDWDGLQHGQVLKKRIHLDLVSFHVCLGVVVVFLKTNS